MYSFDHVGMLVHDIQGARAALHVLGYDGLSELFRDERQGIEIQFVWRTQDAKAPRLELVQAVRPDSVVSTLLAKTGATPYHLCFRAPLLEHAIEAFDEQGYMLVREPAPAPAFYGARFCFMYQRHLGLIELVEMPELAAGTTIE